MVSEEAREIAIKRVKGYKIVDLKNSNEYKNLLQTKLIDLQSKHIPYVSKETQKLYDLALKVDYTWVVFGSHKKGCTLVTEKQEIEELANLSENRPVRIIFANDNRLWVDNTHWAIAYINKIGKDAKLKDIPFYLIDQRNEDEIIVVDYKDSLIKNDNDIKVAIGRSLRINDRLNNGWRPKDVSYTIGELRESMFNEMENSNNL